MPIAQATIYRPNDFAPWKHWLTWTAIAAGPYFLAVAIFVFQGTAYNTGDGAEYYAMAVAIGNSHRPYLKSGDWAAYEVLRKQDDRLSLPPGIGIGVVKKIVDGVEQDDFNHFWLYSAGAAITHAITRIFNPGYSISFYTLHCALLAGLMFLSRLTWSRVGPWAVLLLWVCSPFFWYGNKIHTEFVTFICTAAAISLFCRYGLLWASVPLALAGTQNPPWLLVVAYCIALHFIINRSKPVTFGDASTLALTFAISLLHPAYYFTRYQAVSPQLMTGAASLSHSKSAAEILAPLLDLDIGLIPNWPFGVLILGCWTIFNFRRLKEKSFGGLVLLAAPAFFAILYCQSRTENINHGATIDVSRYGLWYGGFLLPCVAGILKAPVDTSSGIRGVMVGSLLVLTGAANAIKFNPGRSNPQNYTKPTALSNFVQGNLPALYDPPWEIFAERFGKEDESPSLRATWAIATPNSRKLLIQPKFFDSNNPQPVLGSESFILDPLSLYKFVTTSKGVPLGGGYVILSENELARLDRRLLISHDLVTVDPTDDRFFGSGWWRGERSGRIAKAKTSELIFQAHAAGQGDFLFELSGYAPTDSKWYAEILLNGRKVSQASEMRFVHQVVHIEGKVREGTNHISIISKDIVSPAQVGENSDTRLLGTVFISGSFKLISDVR